MPKHTFFKLKEEKKEAIIQAFLFEFSHHSYEDASITAVVKKLGIAKGSIYQYFEDKLDLFLYLKQESEQTKMQYIMHLSRGDYPDFWSYYRELYVQGIKFDEEHPLQSRFLYHINFLTSSPAIKELAKSWKEKALVMMQSMIKKEIEEGHFRNDVPLLSMAHFLYTISISIGEYMERIHQVDVAKNLEQELPLLQGTQESLLESIDAYIILLKSSFNKS